MKSSRPLSIALLVCVMLIWGSTFVVTKAGLGRIPPVSFAFARLAVASVCLLIVAGMTRQLTLPRPVAWRVLLGMAATGVTIYYVAFNLALRYTGASQAALVQSCIPVATVTFAVIFLREPLTARGMTGIALAVTGVIAMFFRAAPSEAAPLPWLGNLLMLGAVICWGAYTVLAKKMAAAPPVTLATYVTLIGTLLLAIPAWLESRASPMPRFLAADWAAVIYLGVFPSALCFVLYSISLRQLEASQVAIFVNLVPLVGVAAGVLTLGESLSSNALFGGALVLTGVWISTRQPRPD